jgi:hypothetical protein
LARIKKAGWLDSHHAQCAFSQDCRFVPHRKELKEN